MWKYVACNGELEYTSLLEALDVAECEAVTVGWPCHVKDNRYLVKWRL